MSMPGVLDSRTGFMHTGGKIECIHDINMAELLEKECKVPVTIENDAKSAALAEVWRGALKDCENAVVREHGLFRHGAPLFDGFPRTAARRPRANRGSIYRIYFKV